MIGFGNRTKSNTYFAVSAKPNRTPIARYRLGSITERSIRYAGSFYTLRHGDHQCWCPKPILRELKSFFM